MLTIQTIPVGPGQANCYIIDNDKEALIIDPGAEGHKITAVIDERQVTPVAILLTHTHFDHIGALDEIRDLYNIPVYVSPEEQDWLDKPFKNLSGYQGNFVTARKADKLFQPDETLQISDFTFKVLATPGHSPGGVSFIFDEEQFAITGDALFGGSIGRTDLPGSEPNQLLISITEKLFTLPKYYTIYPGHGGSSTIDREIKTNPFFQ